MQIRLTTQGTQWLSGRVLESRPRGRGFEPHRRHCFVSLSKNINPSLVLVQPRKTRPFITERLLMGRKEPNKKQLNNTNNYAHINGLMNPLILARSFSNCSTHTSDMYVMKLHLFYLE